MTSLARKLLVVLAGVLLMTAAMVLTIWLMGGRQATGRAGMTLVFEMVDAKADGEAELLAVRQRLLAIAGATASKSGAGKITVWIPYSRTLQEAWAQRHAALEEFRKTQLSPARLEALLKAPATERAAEMARLGPAGSALHDELPQLAEAADQYAAARRVVATFPAGSAPTERLDAVAQKARALDEAWVRVFARTLDVTQFAALLQAADDPPPTGNLAAQRQRDELVVLYPSQATEILHVIAAHRAWVAAGGERQTGPEDIETLLLAHGLLEFRIAVQPAELARRGGVDDYRQVMNSLQQHGSNVPVRTSVGEVRWCEVDANCGAALQAEYVTGFGAGREYLLCYDDHMHTLVHADSSRKPWQIKVGSPYADPAQGGAVLPIRLDVVGASYMGELTKLNQGHALAMLLDNRVLSAPTIHSPIDESCVIVFGGPTAARPAAAKMKDAETVRELLQLPPLPVPLRRVQ